jgi:hypothetical protein
MFGLLGLGMAVYVLKNPSPRLPEQLDHLFRTFTVWSQLVFGAAFACSGAGLYFRRDWGRLGLQAALWAYLAASVVIFPLIVWVWHEMLKQHAGSPVPLSWPYLGLYCLLVAFGLLVLFAIFQALRRIIRELRTARFKDWCSPPARQPRS